MAYSESPINGLDIAKGDVNKHSSINKWGKNPNVNIGTTEDITEIGGIYEAPTTNRTHQIVSDSIQDKGVLIGTYTSTTFGVNTFVDSSATFIADGVSIGDIILNDTNQDHSIVTAIVSETEIQIRDWHHTDENNEGDTIRIIASAGTGAAVLHIKLGYSDEGTELSEFIILNGTTNVPTTNSYFRIIRAHIHGSGSNNTNVGNITAIADVDSSTTMIITPGNGQTQMCYQHIPKGSTGYITSWQSSIYNAGSNGETVLAQMELRSNLWSGDGVVLEYSQGISTGNSPSIVFYPPKKVSQGTDIWATCENVTKDGTEVFSGFNIILIKGH